MPHLRLVGALLVALGSSACQVFLAGAPPKFDLHAYGVVGNGVADDGPAIQAAINDAELRGEPLTIPKPDVFYRIYQTLVVRNATITGTDAEIRNLNGTALRIEGPAHISGLTLTGWNGIDLGGGTLDHVRVVGLGGNPGDGWAIYANATRSGNALIRHSTLIGEGEGAFAVGMLDSAQIVMEDDSIVGAHTGVYIRSRSTLVATRTSIFGGVSGLQLDRKPPGYPVWDGKDRFGDSDIILVDCTITTDPAGPRWDLAVPFIPGIGHVVLMGTTNPANILNNYAGPAGDPPVGPPIGSIDDVIVRR